MKRWTKLGIGAAAIVLAVTAVGGAYATFGSDDSNSTPKAAADDNSVPTGGGMAMCAPGVTDCIDTVVEGEDGDTRLADGECPADMACIEPWLMDPPVCPEGVDLNDCFPTARICADHGVIDPNSVEPGDLPVDPEAERLAADGRLAEPCIDPNPCDTEEPDCLPPNCAVSSDGEVACKRDTEGGNGSSGAGTSSSAPDAGEVAPEPRPLLP